MNEENESIPVVTATVDDLMFHYLEQTTTLLYLARENISLSEQIASHWLSKGDDKNSPKPYRSLLDRQKVLKVSLLRIEKLIEKVKWDREDFFHNSGLDEDDGIISGN
ncbi:hypothetical protein [Microcystis aeruginosa]|uniref:Uncharacterized protein n=1 Tax=Microcystis aeruginosa NIES-3787 TaxID=2517782 RepID=A0A6H9GDX1_MICAE|nr:hypothetical protein [Microcystis aeruginosa]GCL48264.1 hypothetical protein NIES3787_39800 [Microcystis aeruginosa NIES-3787]